MVPSPGEEKAVPSSCEAVRRQENVGTATVRLRATLAGVEHPADFVLLQVALGHNNRKRVQEFLGEGQRAVPMYFARGNGKIRVLSEGS